MKGGDFGHTPLHRIADWTNILSPVVLTYAVSFAQHASVPVQIVTKTQCGRRGRVPVTPVLANALATARQANAPLFTVRANARSLAVLAAVPACISAPCIQTVHTPLTCACHAGKRSCRGTSCTDVGYYRARRYSSPRTLCSCASPDRARKI